MKCPLEDCDGELGTMFIAGDDLPITYISCGLQDPQGMMFVIRPEKDTDELCPLIFPEAALIQVLTRMIV